MFDKSLTYRTRASVGVCKFLARQKWWRHDDHFHLSTLSNIV